MQKLKQAAEVTGGGVVELAGQRWQDALSKFDVPPTSAPGRAPLAEAIKGMNKLDVYGREGVDEPIQAYSEENGAALFAKHLRDVLQWVPEWGTWLVWEGSRWMPDVTGAEFMGARELCLRIAKAALLDPKNTTEKGGARQEPTKRFGTKSTITAVIELAKRDPALAARADQFNVDIFKLNTPGGIVDLRTGKLSPPTADAHMTRITLAAPSKEGCPLWLKFLKDVTGGDNELMGFLQRMAGYCLTGDVSEHQLFFLYGHGGNGKGTFLNTLQDILGDYAQTCNASVFTAASYEQHATSVAALQGARAVIVPEVEEGSRWAEVKLKQFTGGDRIRARYMRQDEFEFMPQFKLVFSGNHKPSLRSVDEAMRRRFNIVPFEIEIPKRERNPKLKEQLMTEAGAILSWAIEGCLQWQRMGLAAPESVLASTDAYLESNDVLDAWLATLDRGEGATYPAGQAYPDYRFWALNSGEKPQKLRDWREAMEEKGFTHGRNKKGQFWAGIGRLEDPFL